jgi:hypothetical protein
MSKTRLGRATDGQTKRVGYRTIQAKSQRALAKPATLKLAEINWWLRAKYNNKPRDSAGEIQC